MIKHFEFQILHLKAASRLEDPALLIWTPSTIERSNSRRAAGRIPQTLNSTQSHFPTSKKRTPTSFNQNLNLVKAEGKAGLHENRGISRNMGGRLLTCDGRPHSPRIKFLSRKAVVGSALLVRYATHITEIFKITTPIDSNNSNKHQKPCLRYFSEVIGLFGLVITFLGSSFEKNLIPGNIQIAGDIRRDA